MVNVRSKLMTFIVTKTDEKKINATDGQKVRNEKEHYVDIFDLNGNLLIHFDLNSNHNHWINSDIKDI